MTEKTLARTDDLKGGNISDGGKCKCYRQYLSATESLLHIIRDYGKYEIEKPKITCMSPKGNYEKYANNADWVQTKHFAKKKCPYHLETFRSLQHLTKLPCPGTILNGKATDL
jgi:hypothetical protein